MQELIPISDFQRTPGRILRQVRESREPVLVTQRGRAVAVLIDKTRFDELVAPARTGPSAFASRRQALVAALEEMLPLIIKRYRPQRILLLGSLARGEVTANSDIDLVVIKNTKKRPLERRKELLRLVRPRVATDFFVYTPQEYQQGLRACRTFFAKAIAAEGQILYEEKAA